MCSSNHPITLTVILTDKLNPDAEITNYTGYIPHRKDIVAIDGKIYKVIDRFLNYQDSKITNCVLAVEIMS